MATTIKLKNSVTTTAAPSTLVQGEAAVNVTDKKVWVGDASSSPVQIIGAGAPVSGTTGTFTGNVSVAGTFAANGGATLGDASGDALTINSSAVSIPNGLNFDSNTFVIDATNNRVGVGVASPAKQFQISNSTYAQIRLNPNSQYASIIEFVDDASVTNAAIYAWGSTNATPNALSFDVNGSERMRITSTGNVGIGTSSPSQKLQLYTGSATATYARIGNTLNDLYAGVDATGNVVLSSDNATYSMIFQTVHAERMRIDSSGNLGIGTSSPSGRLSVTTSTMTNQIIADSMSDSTTYGLVSLNASRTSTSYLGIAGGGGTDKTLFYNVPSTGKHSFRNNFSEQMVLDSSGNLGLGVTPSAWASSYKSLDVVNSSFMSGSGNYLSIASNAYNDGAWKYKATGSNGTLYQQSSGQHIFYTSASGTAGNAITFTQAMTLDSSGNLLVGDTAADWSTSGRGLIEINGSSTSLLGLKTGSTQRGYIAASTTITELGSVANPLVFTVSTERMRLDSSGNLGLGVTPSAWASGTKAIEMGGTSPTYLAFNSTSNAYGYLYSNCYYNGTNNIYKISSYANAFGIGNGGAFQWFTAPSGTAGNAITFTQAMTLDASGNLGIGTTSPRSAGAGYQGITLNGTNSGFLDINTNGTRIFTMYGITNDAYFVNPTATGNLLYYTNNTERMRIDSSGNLFIGGTGVGGGQTFKTTVFTNTASTVTNNLMLSNKGAGTGAGVRLSMSGYDNSDRGAYIEAAISSGSNGHHLAFATQDAGAAPTEKMRIDVSGNLMVGTTTLAGNGFTMYPNGSGGGIYTVYNRPATSSTTTALDFKDGGTTKGSISYTNTATSFNTSSDYRLKENVAPMTGALAKNALLKPCTYTWKADGSAGEGFIAHELAEVMPNAVTGEKDAVNEDGSIKPQGIDTSFLVGHLVACIQELKAEVDSLKAQLNK